MVPQVLTTLQNVTTTAAQPLDLNAPPHILYSQIRGKCIKQFGTVPCRRQIRVALAAARNIGVVAISATGSGKTLPMFLHTLLESNPFVLITLPLKAIAEQMKMTAESLGLRA